MTLFDPELLRYRLYIFTVTYLNNTFYEKPSEGAHNLEIHCEIALPGSIHANRQRLKDFGVRLFQQKASELYGIDFSPSEIKVRFEIEQPAFESTPYVTADILEMTYLGKQIRSRRFPTETIPYYVEYDLEYESVQAENDSESDEDDVEDHEDDDDDEFDDDDDYIEEDD